MHHADVYVAGVVDEAGRGRLERELALEPPARRVARVVLMGYSVRRTQPAVHAHCCAFEVRTANGVWRRATLEPGEADSLPANVERALARATGRAFGVDVAERGRLRVRSADGAALAVRFGGADSAASALGFGEHEYAAPDGVLVAPAPADLAACGVQLMTLTLNHGGVALVGSEQALGAGGGVLLHIVRAHDEPAALVRPSDHGERALLVDPPRVATHVRLDFAPLDAASRPVPFFGAQRVVVLLRLHFTPPPS
jgi:hypothetical protein